VAQKDERVGGSESSRRRNMQLTSPDFKAFDEIPSRFTCDGEGMSPTLRIADVPEGALSLVLVLEDPDAPSETFVHWVVFDIDPATTEIQQGEAPEESIEGVNSAGKRAYAPPCPPSGTHRYFFKLYALDTAVDLPEFITADQLLHRVKRHVITETELVGLYGRK
jgi:Raf kinase inhibitor-like YbhB/YbcL family protein